MHTEPRTLLLSARVGGELELKMYIGLGTVVVFIVLYLIFFR